MGERTIVTKPWDAFAGFLLFKGVGSGNFNDLHVSVTTNKAGCGKGFHFSAYRSQVLNTYVPANAVARIYFTVDDTTGEATQGAGTGDYQPIVGSWFFSSWKKEALEFYLELFEITIAKSFALKAEDFPSFKPAPTATGPATQAPGTATGLPPTLPNPLVVPTSVPAGNPEFFAMVQKNLDYSKGYSLF